MRTSKPEIAIVVVGAVIVAVGSIAIGVSVLGLIPALAFFAVSGWVLGNWYRSRGGRDRTPTTLGEPEKYGDLSVLWVHPAEVAEREAAPSEKPEAMKFAPATQFSTLRRAL